MSNDQWSTPGTIFNPLDQEFKFDLDVCAEPWNAKCENFFSPQDNGLIQKWGGSTCWMNPPYDRKIDQWIRKAWASAEEGATVVCLVPARTETDWWHDYCLKGDIRFVRGRIWFENHTGKSGRPRLGSAIVIFYARREIGNA